MRHRTSNSELEPSSVPGGDSAQMDSSSDNQNNNGKRARRPTSNLSEISSGAVLKELSKQDSDRPDIGPVHWLIIAALILKKVTLVTLLLVFAYWLFY